MRIIKPSIEILPQENNLFGIYRQIERAGRTCYKSEDKITDDSAEKFVSMLINRGHTAMLEHGTIYLFTDHNTASNYYHNKYSIVNKHYDTNISKYKESYITTNYRVIVENGWLDDLEYICKPTQFHEKRISVKFITDRGISHELVRHRVFSYAQESTRYVSYNKEKHGATCTFIIPEWIKDLPEGSYNILEDNYIIELPKTNDEDETIMTFQSFIDKYGGGVFAWLNGIQETEVRYMELTNFGWQAQQARNILPNSLKTEIIMTGFESDWKGLIMETMNPISGENVAIKKGFKFLRTDITAHPQMRELAIPLCETLGL